MSAQAASRTGTQPLAPSARPSQQLAATAAFRGTRDQVRLVRNFVARLLAGWPEADDLVLCASELAANAIVHSASGKPGGTFWLHLTAVPREYIRVEVCDQGGPWLQRDRDMERPHGLDIVRELASRFGVDGDDNSGRIVWTCIDLTGLRGPQDTDSQDSGSGESNPESGTVGIRGQTGSGNGRPGSPVAERRWPS